MTEAIPATAAFLDWPTEIDDNEVWCAKTGCTAAGCASESQGWICSRYGLTARILLAGIEAHAGTLTCGPTAG